MLPDIIGTALDNGAEIDALAKLSVEKQQSLAQAAKRGEQVSAIPRDHNPNQMSDVSEIERSGCNDPEVPHLDVERSDTSEVKDERISPHPDGAMPDADAQWPSQYQAVKAKQTAFARKRMKFIAGTSISDSVSRRSTSMRAGSTKPSRLR